MVFFCTLRVCMSVSRSSLVPLYQHYCDEGDRRVMDGYFIHPITVDSFQIDPPDTSRYFPPLHECTITLIDGTSGKRYFNGTEIWRIIQVVSQEKIHGDIASFSQYSTDALLSRYSSLGAVLIAQAFVPEPNSINAQRQLH